MIKVRYYIEMSPAVELRQIREKMHELQSRCMDLGFYNISKITAAPAAVGAAIAPVYTYGFRCGFGMNNGSRHFSVILNRFKKIAGRKIPWFCDDAAWAGLHQDDRTFRTQHLAIIESLDAASRLGFTVKVRDESGYWKSRDVGQLLAVKRIMERFPDPRQLFHVKN